MGPPHHGEIPGQFTLTHPEAISNLLSSALNSLLLTDDLLISLTKKKKKKEKKERIKKGKETIRRKQSHLLIANPPIYLHQSLSVLRLLLLQMHLL